VSVLNQIAPLADVLGQPAVSPRRLLGTPRRLLHVFPNFNVGGAQVRLISLAEGLGDGFEHTVMALNGRYEASTLLPPRAAVRLYGEPPSGNTLLARLKAFKRTLDEFRPDLLLTYNWGAIEVAMANLLGRTPHLHMEDGFGPEEAVRQIRRRVWTRRLVLGVRSHVVVPSVNLQDIAVGEWGLSHRRVHFIPNAIAPRLHASRSIETLGLDLPSKRPRIVWAGALRPEKNPLRLLRAFAPIKDEAVLLVLGSGPESETMLREARRLNLGTSLRLLGRRTDIRDIVMQSHLVALSSDTEQMPLVVLEAMDAGLPVAACDVGDVRRMVALENRPFITALNEEALGAAMKTLVGDANLRARIGEANRRRIRSHYTLPIMIETYSALLNRMSRS